MKQNKSRVWPSFVILLGAVILFAGRYSLSEQTSETEIRAWGKKTVSDATEPKAMPEEKPTSDAAQVASASPAPKVDAKTETTTTSAVPFAAASDPAARELGRLAECARTHECAFDNSTPRSYDTELNQRVLAELKKLHSENPNAEATRVAQAFMTYPEDEVKSSALEIIAASPASPESMKAVISGLKESISGPLYAEAIETLEQYKGEPALDQFLLETMKTGGHYTSIEIARNILPFLSEKNAAQFKSALKALPLKSTAREFAEANLREYQRLQTGG